MESAQAGPSTFLGANPALPCVSSGTGAVVFPSLGLILPLCKMWGGTCLAHQEGECKYP